ncbi:MAG: hypothetical protein LR015_06025 [Verrucomicrobia bacterium]|nr:hypothetical protein [Verrucomicrobiota bacterium]
MRVSYFVLMVAAIGAVGASRLMSQVNPPLFGAWDFSESSLVVGVGERWRFELGDANNALAVANGRLEYAAGAEGLRSIGWVAPSTAFDNYSTDWAAEVSVANHTRPQSGFTYGGMETYVLSDLGGSVHSSAYYGVYLRSDASGLAVVADWGRWNLSTNQFDRYFHAMPIPNEVGVRLRMLWRAASKQLTVAYSVNGEGFIPLKTYDLLGAQAPLSHPVSNGMGIMLTGVNRGGAAPVAAGEIVFDDMFVYAPAAQVPSLYGKYDFTGPILEAGIDRRWRFLITDPGNSLVQRNNRLEYESSQTGSGFLGWITPSTSERNYRRDWTAEVTVTNDTQLQSGFTYAGMDTYVLQEVNGIVGNSAYYGIYLRSNSSGRAIVSEWGIWDSNANTFIRSTSAANPVGAGPIRLRLSWLAESETLEVSYSTDGGHTFNPAGQFALAGAQQPPQSPWMEGMAIQLSGVSNGLSVPVTAGQITFDAMEVSGPPVIPALFGSYNFDDNDLIIAPDRRWRFDAGNDNNTLTNRNGRLEYESTGRGLRWLGWASPSSAQNNYSYDWAAEVTITNDVNPADGFVAAGLEAYVLNDASGPLTNNAYYGIYISNFGGQRSFVSEWGTFNPDINNFERKTEWVSAPAEGPVRVRMTWRADEKTMSLYFSVNNGFEYQHLRTFRLDREHAPFGSPWNRGFGIQLIGNNQSGGVVTAGQITHDNVVVYPPSPRNVAGFFGRAANVEGIQVPGRYEVLFTNNQAQWTVTGSQLNFTADATSPSINNANQAEQIIFWSNTGESNTSAQRNWTAEGDFSIERLPVSVNAASFLGLEVTPAESPGVLLRSIYCTFHRRRAHHHHPWHSQ